MSVFLQRNHLFLRHPNGGVEDVSAMAAAGFGAIFCNVGDHDPATWQTIRNRAASAGVVCGPWLRTATADNRFDFDKFHKLLRIADEWGTPLIVNTESEIQGTGAEITTYIDQQLGARDGAISVEAWPFDNVGWWPLAARPVLPQAFKADVGYDEPGLRDVWHAYGIRCVVCTCGSYGGSSPADYELRQPYGVYTADDCGGSYSPWAPRGTVEPCASSPPPEPTPTPPPDDMKIGSQNGVTASLNRLRDMDPSGTLLVKQGSKWPSIDTITKPIDQWKAYDKLERALTILVEDHDAAQGGATQMRLTVTLTDILLAAILVVLILFWQGWIN